MLLHLYNIFLPIVIKIQEKMFQIELKEIAQLFSIANVK